MIGFASPIPIPCGPISCVRLGDRGVPESGSDGARSGAIEWLSGWRQWISRGERRGNSRACGEAKSIASTDREAGMADIERIREDCNGSLDLQYVRERQQAGWRLVGVEWEREAAAKAAEPGAGPRASIVQELPLGSRIVPEGGRLAEDADEMQFLYSVMELIIQDISIVKVAEELNRRGFRTRMGNEWGPVAIFNLLPRLIELTPRIFRSEEWAERRKHLTPVF